MDEKGNGMLYMAQEWTDVLSTDGQKLFEGRKYQRFVLRPQYARMVEYSRFGEEKYEEMLPFCQTVSLFRSLLVARFSMLIYAAGRTINVIKLGSNDMFGAGVGNTSYAPDGLSGIRCRHPEGRF